jgi:hypothetical protein
MLRVSENRELKKNVWVYEKRRNKGEQKTTQRGS